MKKRSLVVVAVFVLVLALVSASLVLAGQGVSISTAPTGSAPSGPEPVAPTAGTISITHSTSQQILAGNSVSCNDGIGHTDNAYLRRFTLADFGITGDFEVTDIEVAIESSNNSQPATINLYLWNPANPFTYANFTSIGSFPVTVPSGALFKQMHSVAPTTVPAGSTLVVEFFTPNGQAAGNLMWIGSNNLGQSDDSFLAAAACGVAQPTATGVLGFPGMHVVKNVYGSEVIVSNPAISLDKTVGTDPGVCATTDAITVPAGYGGTDVYYCYTVTNTGDLTLTLHDLVDSNLGPILDGLSYALGPGESVDTVSAGLVFSATITETTTNDATWTACNPTPQEGGQSCINGTDVVTATDSATVTQGAPTGVSLSGFGADTGVDSSLAAVAALLAIVAGLGLVMRRKFSS
jgi:hypothetical protein